MPLPMKDAFTAPAIKAFYDTYKQSLGEPPFLGDALFPKERTGTLDLRFFEGSAGVPVSLTASNYDAQATLRNPIGFSEFEFDMPFFRESYLLKEKDIQDYENCMASNDILAKEMLRKCMLTPASLVTSANVSIERMRWQLLAPIDGSPRIVINSNNVTHDYNYDKDNKYKNKHYLELTSATDKWTDTVNSNPFEDLRKAKKEMTKLGKLVSYAVMNDETFQLICQNAHIKEYILSQNVTAHVMVTEALVKNIIKENIGLQIVLYDKIYLDENLKEQKYVPFGMVCLLPSLSKLGVTKMGITPEERTGSQSQGSLSIVDNGVSIYTFTQPHPLVQQCVVSEIPMPTFERIYDTYAIKAADQAQGV